MGDAKREQEVSLDEKVPRFMSAGLGPWDFWFLKGRRRSGVLVDEGSGYVVHALACERAVTLKREQRTLSPPPSIGVACLGKGLP